MDGSKETLKYKKEKIFYDGMVYYVVKNGMNLVIDEKLIKGK